MTDRMTMIVVTKKTKNKKIRHQSSETVKADRMSVHVQDDDDNVSLLLNGAKTDHVNLPGETLKNLAEMLRMKLHVKI